MAANSSPNEVPSTSLQESAAEDLVADTHIHYDDGYLFCFDEIASLFEDIAVDLNVITTRLDDEGAGLYFREADAIAPNPNNIMHQALEVLNLEVTDLLPSLQNAIGAPSNMANTNPLNMSAIQNAGPGTPPVGGGAAMARPPGYAGQPTITNPSTNQQVPISEAELAAIVEAQGEATGNVRYGNQGGKRNLPIQQELMDILDAACTAAGVDGLITSGGQVPTSEGGVNGVNRTGSNRHDRGYGADIALFVPDFNGRQLSSRNPNDLGIMMTFMRECRDRGATAIGQGNGYMSDNVIHVDIAWNGQKAGQISGILASRTWGGGDSTGTSTNYANAPQYMKDLMQGTLV